MPERMNVTGAPYASRASMGKGDRRVWSFGAKKPCRHQRRLLFIQGHPISSPPCLSRHLSSRESEEGRALGRLALAWWLSSAAC